jgi:hypothetical protein
MQFLETLVITRIRFLRLFVYKCYRSLVTFQKLLATKMLLDSPARELLMYRGHLPAIQNLLFCPKTSLTNVTLFNLKLRKKHGYCNPRKPGQF